MRRASFFTKLSKSFAASRPPVVTHAGQRRNQIRFQQPSGFCAPAMRVDLRIAWSRHLVRGFSAWMLLPRNVSHAVGQL